MRVCVCVYVCLCVLPEGTAVSKVLLVRGHVTHVLPRPVAHTQLTQGGGVAMRPWDTAGTEEVSHPWKYTHTHT